MQRKIIIKTSLCTSDHFSVCDFFQLILRLLEIFSTDFFLSHLLHPLELLGQLFRLLDGHVPVVDQPLIEVGVEPDLPGRLCLHLSLSVRLVVSLSGSLHEGELVTLWTGSECISSLIHGIEAGVGWVYLK